MKTKEQEIAENLSAAINIYADVDKVAEAFTREHRTIQQGLTRLCVAWLKTNIKADIGYDLRNEGTVKFAQAVKEAGLFDKAYLPKV